MFDCKRVRKVSPWVNILVVSWISRVGPVIAGVILATCWLHLQISTDYIGLASDGSQNENAFNIYIYIEMTKLVHIHIICITIPQMVEKSVWCPPIISCIKHTSNYTMRVIIDRSTINHSKPCCKLTYRALHCNHGFEEGLRFASNKDDKHKIRKRDM